MFAFFSFLLQMVSILYLQAAKDEWPSQGGPGQLVKSFQGFVLSI